MAVKCHLNVCKSSLNAFKYDLNANSNCRVFGPIVSHPESKESLIDSNSLFVICGL